MKVILTESALVDLGEIYLRLSQFDSLVRRSFKRQLLEALDRIKHFPQSSPRVAERKVHCVILSKYPYKIFYTVGPDFIEVLHIYHSARNT